LDDFNAEINTAFASYWCKLRSII